MRWRAVVCGLALVLLTPAPLPTQQTTEYTVKGLVKIGWTDLHDTVYRMMEDCSGREGDLDRFDWYATESISRTADGKPMKGFVTWEPRRVVLAAPWVYSGHTVAHEALHEIWGPDDTVPMDVADRCVLSPVWFISPDMGEP